ncbi:unnamed protein product [Prunus armeniaca]
MKNSPRTEMTLASRWKILNKELGKWRDVLAKARDNIRSGQHLSDKILQAQCWEVVKNCSRFKIISTSPQIVLNEMPLHDSPLDSPIDQDSPLPHVPRPIGRKTAKTKRGSTLNNECAQFLEQIAKNNALRIERLEKRRSEQGTT